MGSDGPRQALGAGAKLGAWLPDLIAFGAEAGVCPTPPEATRSVGTGPSLGGRLNRSEVNDLLEVHEPACGRDVALEIDDSGQDHEPTKPDRTRLSTSEPGCRQNCRAEQAGYGPTPGVAVHWRIYDLYMWCGDMRVCEFRTI